MRRAVTSHTDWCARDHRCNLAEHRSGEHIVDLPGHGRAVVTRVKATDGREYAEIRARIPLHHTENGARWQLGAVLSNLDRLLAAVAIRRGRSDRAAINRGAA